MKANCPEEKPLQPAESKQTHYRAYIFASLSATCTVLSQLCLKQMSHYFNIVLLLGVRGSLMFLCLLGFLIRIGRPVNIRDPQVFVVLTKRCLLSAVALILYLSSVKYIPIGIANALYNTMPIMSFLCDYLYFKKARLHLVNLVLVLASFAGVLLIIQPPFLFGAAAAPEHLASYLFYLAVLVAALAGSFEAIYLHQMKGKVEELVVLVHNQFFHALGGYFLFMLVSFSEEQQPDNLHNMTLPDAVYYLGFMALIATIAFTRQLLQTKAIFMCSPALILPFNYVSVIVGLLIDVFLLDASYNSLMVVGVILASAGVFSKFLLLYLQPAPIADPAGSAIVAEK